MPRYIDAKDLVKRMEPQDMLDANDIAEFPTADVVPVVRCKDCQHCYYTPEGRSEIDSKSADSLAAYSMAVDALRDQQERKNPPKEEQK